MNKFVFCLLAAVIVMTSCRENITELEIIETREQPSFIDGYNPPFLGVQASVTGHVIDKDNLGIENATVRIGNLTTTTNEYGHFFFKDVEMNQQGTYVEIDKDGYFTGSRRFYPISGKTSLVKIELMDKVFAESFEASAGGKIPITLGGNVEFQPNSITDGSAELYDGDVMVAAQWLNPISRNTLQQMPGDLTGVDELNEEVALATFGMVAVELETANGDPLYLAKGNEAVLTFPVPSELLSSAPQEIPLWYFNEHYGIWAQEGSAELVGTNYVGSVKHFTLWNCDAPYDLITLDLTLVDDNDEPMANHMIKFSATNASSGTGFTDQEGYLIGKVPANEVLTMEVFSNCGDIILTQDIGPYSDDVSLGNISIPSSVINTTISGNLLNCDGNPVTDGLVVATFNGFSEYLYTDGSPFTLNLTTCPTTSNVDITAVDFDNPGHVYNGQVTAGTTTDLGDMDVCDIGGAQNTITVNVDGVQFIYSGATADVGHVDSIGTWIESNLGQDLFCGFGFESITTGTHNGYIEVIVNTDLGWALSSFQAVEFVVTEFGPNPGDKIIGTFSGSLFQQGQTYNVDIAFDITRE